MQKKVDEVDTVRDNLYSCAFFLVLHAIFDTVLSVFACFCPIFAHFFSSLQILTCFARSCAFFHTFLCVFFQAKSCVHAFFKLFTTLL